MSSEIRARFPNGIEAGAVIFPDDWATGVRDGGMLSLCDDKLSDGSSLAQFRLTSCNYPDDVAYAVDVHITGSKIRRIAEGLWGVRVRIIYREDGGPGEDTDGRGWALVR